MDSKDDKLARGDEQALLGELGAMIESARGRAAVAVNSGLVMLYWDVGKRVRNHVLEGKRAEYGRAVVKRVAAALTVRYGRGYGQRNLERMVRFAEVWPDAEIASTLSTQLSWSHFTELLLIREPVSRDFYAAFAANERWSVRTLRAKVVGKLYKRTIAARSSVDGLTGVHST